MNDTTSSTTPASPEPEPTGPEAIGPESATTPSATPSPPAAHAETPIAPAPGTGDDEWDEEDSILTWKLLVACAIVLGIIGVGAYLLFNGKKKDGGTAATEGTTIPATAEPPAIRDDFDRADNPASLGKTSTGEDWQAALGTWGVRDKQALVTTKNPTGPRNIAVIDTGSGDGAVGARAAKLADGWGLVFRYRGPNAYWSISWVEQFKSFRITKLENGKGTDIEGGVPVGNARDGMDVRVEFVGPTITVFVDGKPLRTISDGYLKGETKVGLYVPDKGADTARWADFIARKELTGPPITAPPTAKDKPKNPNAKGAGGTQAPKAGNGGGTSTTVAGAAPAKK